MPEIEYFCSVHGVFIEHIDHMVWTMADLETQLPENYNWQKLKDLARSAANNLGWVEISPAPYQLHFGIGCIKVTRRKDADNLYSEFF